jgi:hypothetical protein
VGIDKWSTLHRFFTSQEEALACDLPSTQPPTQEEVGVVLSTYLSLGHLQGLVNGGSGSILQDLGTLTGIQQQLTGVVGQLVGQVQSLGSGALGTLLQDVTTLTTTEMQVLALITQLTLGSLQHPSAPPLSLQAEARGE